MVAGSDGRYPSIGADRGGTAGSGGAAPSCTVMADLNVVNLSSMKNFCSPEMVEKK